MNEIKWYCDQDLSHMTKKHRNDACFDICCAEDITIPPFPERVAIKTNLHISLPDGSYAEIKPRSGLALKHGIEILGGLIDEGYTGEIVVIMRQGDNEPVSFPAGSRIAQLLVSPRFTGPITRVATPEQLGEHERGANGFGSTGV